MKKQIKHVSILIIILTIQNRVFSMEVPGGPGTASNQRISLIGSRRSMLASSASESNRGLANSIALEKPLPVPDELEGPEQKKAEELERKKTEDEALDEKIDKIVKKTHQELSIYGEARKRKHIQEAATTATFVTTLLMVPVTVLIFWWCCQNPPQVPSQLVVNLDGSIARLFKEASRQAIKQLVYKGWR